ncbi:hypothetical protein [Nonomuraea sp. KM90]|uniref:hypothetical protein n=1 Tax=Nonomuraea sp. KM90 TaxID=3457428 RepID=UPI003FCE46A2
MIDRARPPWDLSAQLIHGAGFDPALAKGSCLHGLRRDDKFSFGSRELHGRLMACRHGSRSGYPFSVGDALGLDVALGESVGVGVVVVVVVVVVVGRAVAEAEGGAVPAAGGEELPTDRYASTPIATNTTDTTAAAP